MIKKSSAKKIRDLSLAAIEDLSMALNIAKEQCSGDYYETIKKGVGLSIGRIQTGVLDVLYEAHPDLDDLS